MNSCPKSNDFKKGCIPTKKMPVPAYFETVVVPTSVGEANPETGDYTNSLVKYEADGRIFLFDGRGVYTELVQAAGEALVNSVNGKTGDVVLTAEDVGATSQEEFESRVAEIELAIGDVESSVTDEIADREAADNNLQSQIDAISASSDVTDIVGTYTELQAYDTTTLSDKDIIKVLQDETHNDETTYYRWSTTTHTFTLIGEEGPYYTKAAADAKFQDKLTPGSNITIDANNEISATDTTYSDFTGTDGTTAGASGLVPAPATTDADKFLKSDGTWDTAGSTINVVQTTGTSTTDVMSQNAVTATFFNDPSTMRQIHIGGSTTATGTRNVSIGGSITNSVTRGIVIGGETTASGNYSVFIGHQTSSTVSADAYTVALGYSSKNTRRSEVSVGDGSASTTVGTRYIANVRDPQLAQDAATKNYVDTAIAGAGGATVLTNTEFNNLWENA